MYIIAWKSKSRGSTGRGKTLFSREEAETLAKELNEEHPDFLHEPVRVGGASTLAHELQLSPLNLSEIGVVTSEQEEVFA